eukprot:1909662-Alexandrium_andersonii.AAC.1
MQAVRGCGAAHSASPGQLATIPRLRQEEIGQQRTVPYTSLSRSSPASRGSVGTSGGLPDIAQFELLGPEELPIN